jgi:hypothetical protein
VTASRESITTFGSMTVRAEIERAIGHPFFGFFKQADGTFAVGFTHNSQIGM